MTNYFAHSHSLIETTNIGAGSKIWAFTHILPHAKIGINCNICNHVFIENDVNIGNNVTIKCGVQLWDGIHIEDDVFVGPNATFANDKWPRSKQYPESYLKTIIKSGASIGANATILPGITIGRQAMVGAGSVVTKDVPDFAIVYGNPGKITGYTNNDFKAPPPSLVNEVKVKGVSLHNIPVIRDLRGNLSAGEVGKHIPFVPKRYFIVYDVPNTEIRGEHAHKDLHQFLICLKGSCVIRVDDGNVAEEVLLDRPSKGIYIQPKVWGKQYKYTQDAILLVFASDFYQSEDYIREYQEFLSYVGK